MARKNVPKKVRERALRKKNADEMWDKKLKTLRKTYQQPPKGGRRENTPFHMPNVIVRGRLRSHVLGGDNKKW